MTKSVLLGFVPMLFTFVGVSCSSNADEPLSSREVEAHQLVSDNGPRGLTPASVANDPGSISSLNQIAVDYVNNAKTLLYATGALDKPSQTVSSYESLLEDGSSSEVNPMSLRLQLLDIVDEDSGKPIKFYDLSPEHKAVFVDKLLQEDATTISTRLELAPEAGYQLELENEATRELIQQSGLTMLRVGEPVGTRPSLSSVPGSSEMSSPEIKKVDHNVFFSALQKGIESKLNSQGKRSSGFRLAGGSFNYPKLSVDKVRLDWVWSARPGDFVVALPVHNIPWIYVNIGDEVSFKVGHAGIIDSNITSWTHEKAEVTVEAYKKNGVKRSNIASWNTPHYVMGVQRVRYRWRWRGFRSGFYKETRPVSNPEALAYWANQYLGRKYVRWYEFLTAKWAAPSRFTCTTLVWWCAKKAYGINVSSWYSPLVSPSGLFTDDETYIRRNVQ